ncbi:MAG: hypothetical protein JW809_00185 [Pirellulales bacterium]|nr:hypothetical protein [Pirellulales bacterium]
MIASSPIVVGLGEVLWDVFPDGPRFGGAPANFACHAAALGAAAHMVSCVGADELGEKALETLRYHRVDTATVGRSAEFPTGTVRVDLGTGQPRYEITTGVAWDHLAWSDELAALAARTNAVCFGTLGQRGEASRAVIARFVQSTRPAALRILDINLRPPFFDDDAILRSLGLANVLKLNDEELPMVASACGLAGTDLERMAQLRERFGISLVALTRGARGAVLIRDDEVSDQPAVATHVVDTVGAGDAFTAAMTLGLLRGRDLDTINRSACQTAAHVCAHAGAAPRRDGPG